MKRLATGCAAALALALCAAPARAQEDRWLALVAESDSVGPEPPRVRPGPTVPCGRGVRRADSVQVTGRTGEYLLSRYSMFKRGLFDPAEPPAGGAGRFALLQVHCRQEDGRPDTFVLERDHRYFYVAFVLRPHPTFADLSFRAPGGGWRPFRWDPARHTFGPAGRR